jgi:hypothetical protein
VGSSRCVSGKERTEGRGRRLELKEQRVGSEWAEGRRQGAEEESGRGSVD